jgi:hypothetical protein
MSQLAAKAKIRRKFIYIALILYYYLIPPPILFLLKPFPKPYDLTINNWAVILSLTFAGCLIVIIILFVLFRICRKFDKGCLFKIMGFSGIFIVLLVPYFVQKIWGARYEQMMQDKFHDSLAMFVDDNPLDKKFELFPKSKLLNKDISPKAIVFDLTNKQIDFELGNQILGPEIKYPKDAKDLDYLILMKTHYELWKIMEASKIFFGSRETYHLYKLNKEIAIIDWRTKKMIARPKIFEAQTPMLISARYIHSDEYYEPATANIRDWVAIKLLTRIDSGYSLVQVDFLIFIALYLLPLIVIGIATRNLRSDVQVARQTEQDSTSDNGLENRGRRLPQKERTVTEEERKKKSREKRKMKKNS